jgi:4-hydroxybenzoate polyprenyltransferase
MAGKLIPFLRLIRYKNLLIVAATMYLMRHAIIQPILGINDFRLQLDDFRFFLLVLASVMVTAAGYVINDYFDTRTDLLNRPGRVVVGRQLSKRAAIILHWLLNLTGFLFGFYIAFHVGVPIMGVFFVLAAGLLWFYSTTYNRQFLTGNLVISFLTAMVPVTVVLFELPALYREYDAILRTYQTSFAYIFAWVGSFGYFAFVTTLMRELIKDIEDLHGDVVQGRKSVPIVLGIPNTKLIIGGLIIVTFVSLAYLYKAYLMVGFFGQTDYLSLLYFLVFLFAPLLLLLYNIIRAVEKSDYKFAHNLAKLIMLSGISYALLVRYIIISSF